MDDLICILTKHATSLRVKLDKIQALIEALGDIPVAEVEAALQLPAPAPETKPEPPPAPVHKAGPKSKTRIVNLDNVGSRKAVTLALFTGPATCRELSRALVWDPKRTDMCLMGMYHEKERLATVNAGTWSLTEKGRTMARWFIDNPQYRVYSRTRTEAARKSATAKP